MGGGGAYYESARTKRGYMLSEVTSALQKEIRRGKEQEAMYWALELHESGYWRHLWKRLAVIASEDVGTPQASILVHSLRVEYEWITKTSKTTHHHLFIAQAVLYLARAKKNRINDDFFVYVLLRRKHDWRLEIPDYAVDKHTEAGRRRGMGEEEFYSEGALLNETWGENEYEELVIAAMRAETSGELPFPDGDDEKEDEGEPWARPTDEL